MVTETQNYAPPDYGSIPNIGLRDFLITSEEIIRVNPEPIKATGYRFEGFASCGIPLKSWAERITRELRDLGIVRTEQYGEKRGGAINSPHKFGLWGRRAIAAFYWTYLELPFNKTSFAKDFPQRLNTLREALGSHPLTAYIHDPQEIKPVPTANLNSQVITFKDGSVASIDGLSALLKTRHSDEIIDLKALGLTRDQVETIVRMAAKKHVDVIVEELKVERLRACLNTLLIP